MTSAWMTRILVVSALLLAAAAARLAALDAGRWGAPFEGVLFAPSLGDEWQTRLRAVPEWLAPALIGFFALLFAAGTMRARRRAGSFEAASPALGLYFLCLTSCVAAVWTLYTMDVPDVLRLVFVATAALLAWAAVLASGRIAPGGGWLGVPFWLSLTGLAALFWLGMTGAAEAGQQLGPV